MFYLFQGFLLGLAYVAPIGTQNLYVIQSALKKPLHKAFATSFIIFIFDITLAGVCFYGVGLIIEQHILLKKIMLLFGSIFIIFLGISLIKKPVSTKDIDTPSTIYKVIISSFSVTFLNPQAIIDGSMLLGGYKAFIPNELAFYFILGVCLASFIWFMTLTSIISLIHHRIHNKTIKYINMVCGITIILFGLRLVYLFLQL